MAEFQLSVSPLRILVVDDEANIRFTLTMCLEADGHSVVSHGTIEGALEETARQTFDLIFLDLRLGTENGLDYIPQLVQENPWARVVVITAYASVDTAVEAMKRGASDYLPKPFEPAQVQLVTRSVAERRRLERKIDAMQLALGAMDPESDLPTCSPAMQACVDLARQVASSTVSLLVRGEMGTGKGRLARAIHAWSGRSQGPFALVSCQAPSVDAMESELFGPHSENSGPAGAIAFCQGGTLLLDEIGELPMRLQPRLVTLLRDKQLERQDNFSRRSCDVRVVATTSNDLELAVQRGTFRADLLLALNVIQIDIPSLRERSGDIPLLAERYLAFFGREHHRAIGGFTADAMFALTKHTWPGNVRELRNIIERAVLLCDGDQIGLQHLPTNLLNTDQNCAVGDLIPLSMIEEAHIRRVMASARSIRRAAAILGIDSSTLCRKMKRLGQGVLDDQPAA